jgi:isopropylmalate/homocitrate/citramalate synthase
MRHSEILVCDQTIREGMQYRGVVFTYDERKTILKFQESLGIDISQVAYPPAHKTERNILHRLIRHAGEQRYKIRIAGLGRALIYDVDHMIDTGATEIQIHTVMADQFEDRWDMDTFLDTLKKVVHHTRSKIKNARISTSILDIGRTDLGMLEKCVQILSHDLNVEIITLPDTSGIMAPNLLYDRILDIVAITNGSNTKIGVHCHNDMGMATANTVLGAVAGASLIEVSALGIGERNGIGDLFLVGKTLKEQGYGINLKTDNLEQFKAYYSYIDMLIRQKTGASILTYNTPFFGESMKTHVAGTHGTRSFGLDQGDIWLLNVLCGKHLVKKFLEMNHIPYPVQLLTEIVDEIKNRSAFLGRSLSKEDVSEIIQKIVL